MQLDPSQTLLIRRLEESFGDQYIDRAIKSLPLARKIAYRLGIKSHADEIAERAITLMMEDISKGTLCDLYEEKVVADWDRRRERLMGTAKLSADGERQNLQALKSVFSKAHESQDMIARPEYMNNFYDPIRLRVRK